MRDEVEKIIRRIHDLPTLPLIYTRVSDLLRNPYTSASDVAAVISEDQVIAARLLRLVNSAHYSFPERIETITRAVSLVGMKAVKSLVLATSVMDLFDSRSIEGWSTAEFWRHSLGVAVTASTLGARVQPNRDPEEFFVAGLIHDIGKVVWLEHFPDELAELIHHARENKTTMIEAEREIMGFTHVRAGRMLARRWGLGDRLVEAVAWHHDPRLAEHEPEFTAVIHVADALAVAARFGSSGNGRAFAPTAEGIQMTGLEPKQVTELLDTAAEAYEDASTLLDAVEAPVEDASAPVVA